MTDFAESQSLGTAADVAHRRYVARMQIYGELLDLLQQRHRGVPWGWTETARKGAL
ncbi:MAG: hypothetical protein O2797_05635 [Bacteroidetes bacterium]|nr:hypothetical protein [Bacteroidota bacterium]